MTMTISEAHALQNKISSTHPNLGVSIKKVGSELSDEWVSEKQKQATRHETAIP